ncbi:DMT family transporter [Oricola sp.]|uniref:DMT family transporter n=1 Tax=Oricola sp. TaxID=1979950 RepID=UPI003BAB948B
MSIGRPGAFDYLLLIALSIIWGSSFLLSKIAVAEVPPMTVTLLRLILATVLLFAIASAVRQRFAPSGRDHALMVVCALAGNAIPFSLINWGVAVIDSGLAAILMGFMPLVLLILAHVFTHDEKMTVPKLIGVLLGICGLVILFWPELRAGFGRDLIRQLAVLGASLAYAINALATKRLAGHPPLALMAYISAWSVVVLVPAVLLAEDPFAIRPSQAATLALLALGVFPTAVGAMLMIAVIRRQGASFFGQINLLVPVAGVLMGVIFLAEQPGLNALVALAVIFSGILAARFEPKNRQTVPQGSQP